MQSNRRMSWDDLQNSLGKYSSVILQGQDQVSFKEEGEAADASQHFQQTSSQTWQLKEPVCKHFVQLPLLLQINGYINSRTIKDILDTPQAIHGYTCGQFVQLIYESYQKKTSTVDSYRDQCKKLTAKMIGGVIRLNEEYDNLRLIHQTMKSKLEMYTKELAQIYNGDKTACAIKNVLRTLADIIGIDGHSWTEQTVATARQQNHLNNNLGDEKQYLREGNRKMRIQIKEANKKHQEEVKKYLQKIKTHQDELRKYQEYHTQIVENYRLKLQEVNELRQQALSKLEEKGKLQSQQQKLVHTEQLKTMKTNHFEAIEQLTKVYQEKIQFFNSMLNETAAQNAELERKCKKLSEQKQASNYQKLEKQFQALIKEKQELKVEIDLLRQKLEKEQAQFKTKHFQFQKSCLEEQKKLKKQYSDRFEVFEGGLKYSKRENELLQRKLDLLQQVQEVLKEQKDKLEDDCITQNKKMMDLIDENSKLRQEVHRLGFEGNKLRTKSQIFEGENEIEPLE